MSKENGEVIGFKGLFGVVMRLLTSGMEADLAVCIKEISNGISLIRDDDLPRRCIEVCMSLLFWWNG